MNEKQRINYCADTLSLILVSIFFFLNLIQLISLSGEIYYYGETVNKYDKFGVVRKKKKK